MTTSEKFLCPENEVFSIGEDDVKRVLLKWQAREAIWWLPYLPTKLLAWKVQLENTCDQRAASD
jgi:hypothetical protein